MSIEAFFENEHLNFEMGWEGLQYCLLKKNTLTSDTTPEDNSVTNNPSIGPQIGDLLYVFDFLLGPGRFSIGFVSKFRATVAYLEVGSSDLDQVEPETYMS